jgi:chaperone BCS1
MVKYNISHANLPLDRKAKSSVSSSLVAMEDACVTAAWCAAANARVGMLSRAITIALSLWTHVRRQLSNDFIGGSLALATASFLTNLAWRVGRHARRIAYDLVFTTYDIPSGTPQYHAALRWLHSQPAVQRTSRRLVVNPAGSRVAKDARANDPDDPLELGLRTLPLLTRDQSVCVRVGGALVWACHGHVAPSAASAAAAAFDGSASGLGAMGGGGARGSWYSSLLSGARGHVGLASSARSGFASHGRGDSSSEPSERVLDNGYDGLDECETVDGIDGVHGGESLRLRVCSRDPRLAVRAVLAKGRQLGKGAARRYTQVYMPSSAMSSAYSALRAGAFTRTVHGVGDFEGARGEAESGGLLGVVSGAGSSGSGSGFHGGSVPRVRPEWVDAGRRPARPVSSVVLKGDAARSIVDDARAFLRLERWYAERGIPYRRGYLLHGAPGSGKTSLVRAVAGELRLPVYQLPLSGSGVDDEAFHRLLNGTARRSVVLLEDVDAVEVMTVPVKRTAGGFKNDDGADDAERFEVRHPLRRFGGLTLQGLLGALDGVGAAEGRLLFMTCRDCHRLEPALVRPGRIDRRLAFESPDETQAKALFAHFYEGWGVAEAGARAPPSISTEASSARPARALEAIDLDFLADAFARVATDLKVVASDHPLVSSMAALQGHLMSHREDPRGAVTSAKRILANARGESNVAG